MRAPRSKNVKSSGRAPAKSRKPGMTTNAKTGQPSINLKKFKLSSISDDALIGIVGMRRSGKSWLLRDLLYEKRYIPVGSVMSPTAKSSKFFHPFMCPAFIHDNFSPRAMQMMIQRQVKLIDLLNRGELKMTDPHALKAFMIADDCGADKKGFKTLQMRDMAMNGRHRRILTIFTAQHFVDIPNEIRNQLDYLFMFSDKKKQTQIHLFDEFFNSFGDFNIFKNVFLKMTQNKRCMVAYPTGTDLADSVFVYKARDLDNVPFRIAPKCWEFVEKNPKLRSLLNN